MDYEQGKQITLYATFVTGSSTEAKVNSGVVVVSHRYGGSTTVDVDQAVMSQLAGSTYYYTWHPARDADLGSYTVKYIGAYNNPVTEVVVGCEEFQLVPRGAYEKMSGGSVKHVGGEKVWTSKEKDWVIAALEKVSNEEAKLSEIDSKVALSIDSISAISKCLTSSMEAFGTVKADLMESMSKKEVPHFDDSKIISKLSDMEGKIVKTDITVMENRVGLALAELDDLRRSMESNRAEIKFLKDEIDDFKAAFVKTLPITAMERLQDENSGFSG